MVHDKDWHSMQREVCSHHSAEYLETSEFKKIGLADNVTTGLLPLNGLRHPQVSDSSGWFIWAGNELSKDPDFFKPVHAAHLVNLCPQIIPFLGLAPGWRFLIAGDYKDVWYDAALLRPE